MRLDHRVPLSAQLSRRRRLTAAVVSPVGTATLLYILVTVGLLAWGLMLNRGAFSFPLDDTYIHMAMAKRLAFQGIWGPTPHGFCSSSSAPLWTLLLAASFRLVGAQQWIPLAWNAVASILVIWSVDRMVASQWASLRVRRWFLAILVLAAPLPALTLVGMEHTFHIVANLWLVWLGARLVTAGPGRTAMLTAAAAGTAAVASLLRFESLSTVAILSGLLLWRRRPLRALALATAAATPLVAMGLLSQAHGGFWVPNPIMTKGYLPWLGRFDAPSMKVGGRAVRALFNSITLSLTCPLLTIALLLWSRRSRPEPQLSVVPVFGATVLLSIVLHLQFAAVGWLFRYEAYLVVASFVAVAVLTPRDFPSRALRWCANVIIGDWPSRLRSFGLAVLAAVALVTYGARAVQSASVAVLSMNDRLLEHVWPARFVKAFYNEATLVVNDVGAMAFLTEARLLDLYGIASSEPVRWRLTSSSRVPTEPLMEWIAHSDARIAVLQTERSWVATVLPPAWVHVADWRIPRNVAYGDHVVGLFARDREEGRRLADALMVFRQQLPAAIDLELTTHDMARRGRTSISPGCVKRAGNAELS
jgi:hypothetical protein